MIVCPLCKTLPGPDPRGPLYTQACRCNSLFYIPDQKICPGRPWGFALSLADGEMAVMELDRDGYVYLTITKPTNRGVVVLYYSDSSRVPALVLVEKAMDLILARSVLQS